VRVCACEMLGVCGECGKVLLCCCFAALESLRFLCFENLRLNQDFFFACGCEYLALLGGEAVVRVRGLALSLVSTRGGEDTLLGARCVRSTEYECGMPARGGGISRDL